MVHKREDACFRAEPCHYDLKDVTIDQHDLTISFIADCLLLSTCMEAE